MNGQNRKRVLLLILCCHLIIHANAQNQKEMCLNRWGFKEYLLPDNDDTVRFYMRQLPDAHPTKLVVYLQGTTPVPEPFFGVNVKEHKAEYLQYFSSDYALLGPDYAFVLIGLPGVSAVSGLGEMNLNKYHALNGLDYRVHCADTVIRFIDETLFDLDKIIVYGHSEGAPVAAKLATVNQKITHLGFWGGNALPDFFDFILSERKENIRQHQTDSVTAGNIENYIGIFREIAWDSLNTVPADTNEISEYTNKRWWSYAEPPINHLLRVNIPIYVLAATEDESAPVESNYLIPLEFIRLGKNNLTFQVCVGCDHGFVNTDTQTDLWSSFFSDFIRWTER